jgi:hypothetical protein
MECRPSLCADFKRFLERVVYGLVRLANQQDSADPFSRDEMVKQASNKPSFPGARRALEETHGTVSKNLAKGVFLTVVELPPFARVDSQIFVGRRAV